MNILYKQLPIYQPEDGPTNMDETCRWNYNLRPKTTGECEMF